MYARAEVTQPWAYGFWPTVQSTDPSPMLVITVGVRSKPPTENLPTRPFCLAQFPTNPWVKSVEAQPTIWSPSDAHFAAIREDASTSFVELASCSYVKLVPFCLLYSSMPT